MNIIENYVKFKIKKKYVAKSIFAGKNYFWQDGFFHGNNRFLPPSGKNLPTLQADTQSLLCSLDNFDDQL